MSSRSVVSVLPDGSARTWTTPVLVLFLAGISLAISVTAARYARPLADATAPITGGPRLRAGTRLGPFVLYTAGQKRSIEFSVSQPKRMFYFSARDCTWCERNRAAIAALAAQLTTKVDVIGITTDPAPTVDAEGARYPFPVYQRPVDDVIRSFAIRTTPTTVLVSPEGVVEDVWVGPFVGDRKDRIERHLHVALPEVSVE